MAESQDTDKPKILVLFAHPYPHMSRVNRAMAEAVRDLPHVTVRDLYEIYPDFYIDVKREQALLTTHDVIVMQHPVYWYSCPSLLKEWMDSVLEYGWAYVLAARRCRARNWPRPCRPGGPMRPTAPTVTTVSPCLNCCGPLNARPRSAG